MSPNLPSNFRMIEWQGLKQFRCQGVRLSRAGAGLAGTLFRPLIILQLRA